ECSVICRPIGCAVDFVCRLLHLKIILWNKPLEIGLCNKAIANYMFHNKDFPVLNNHEVYVHEI
ncbi:hypothetical protein QZK39_18360, partial [Acinetobacter baumannii]|nr:hypothetical protein [Acinetobacter baumannii]